MSLATTPHLGLPKVGQLIILNPRGYVGTLVSLSPNWSTIRLLDSEAELWLVATGQLIKTNLYGHDLTSPYKPTAQQLAHALEVERSAVEWKKLTAKPKTTSKTKKVKALTAEQKEAVVRLMMQRLKEIKGGPK